MKSETKKMVTSLFLFLAIFGPIKTAAGYLFAPVNCVAETSVKIGTHVGSVLPLVGNDLKDFFECVWGNVTGQSIA